MAKRSTMNCTKESGESFTQWSLFTENRLYVKIKYHNNKIQVHCIL